MVAGRQHHGRLIRLPSDSRLWPDPIYICWHRKNRFQRSKSKSAVSRISQMYQPPRDRDAYASIRGYVYQIDRTLDHWIELRPGQVLELERGEDIDVIGQIVAGGNTKTESRLLEQVKHRETSITLRSSAVLEALANFHDHLVHESGNELRFRFLTNAAVGSEQLNPFPNRTPGITLWEQVRTRQIDGTDLIAAVEHLRSFLTKSQRPDGLNESVWKAWKTYIEGITPEVFREFIDRFEWSTANPDATKLPLLLRSRILSLRAGADEIEAQAIVDRLFVHVARLLSTVGAKRLTVEDRTRLLNEPTLPAADRELLANLRTVVSDHGDRLDELEAEVSALGGRVETIFLSTVSSGHLEFSLPTLELSLPLPVARLSPRRTTAEHLRAQLSTCGWLGLRGGPDTGKSQLALQVAIVHGACRGWVRLNHTLSGGDAARILDAALTGLFGGNKGPTTGLPPDSLLVLDDIPRLTGDEICTECLARLGQMARAAHINIISTSQFELPARLHAMYPVGWLRDQPAPPFTKEEAGDLLRAHGAPASFISEQRLQFLNHLAAGHPLLLTAGAEFLSERKWGWQEEEIGALLRGDHTEAIMPEVIERLTRTLSEPPRELLYRLTLPIGKFSHEEVAAVASVDPVIDRPRERLNQLLGAWVQRDTDTRYEVSPLVRPLGHSEIASDVRVRCFRELAEKITSRSVMDPVACDRAIDYNLEAREHGRAVTLYVVFLMELVKVRRAEHIRLLIDRWRNEPLPEKLTVGNRLFVRAYQLAAFTEYELDTRYISREIDALLRQATVTDSWGVVTLAVQSLSRFRTVDAGRAMQYLRRAIEIPVVLGPDGRVITFEKISFPEMLWMMVTDLRTPALIGEWLDAVAAIPEPQRNQFWTCHFAQQGIWLVANRVYLTEWEKPATSQDWEQLVASLSDLLGRAQSFGQPRLEAAFTSVMLEIVGDRKWLDQAASVADVTLSRWPMDPDVQFKVKGTWGRQLAYQKRPDLALPLLDVALSQAHSQNDHERLRCLLAASISVGPDNLRYAEQARDLARSSVLAPDIEAARALGEYALSLMQNRGGQAGVIAACHAWSEALRRFLGARWKDKIWRDLFPLFAHVTSYVTTMAREGQPPEHACDGGTFLVPSRGFLMKDYLPEREALYRESGIAAVAWLMQAYASASGQLAEADHWMRFAITESRRVGASFIQAATAIDAAAIMLANDKIEDAVEMGVFAGRGTLVQHAIKMRDGVNSEGLGVDIMTEFRLLPEEQRHLGDRFAVISGLLPAAMALARLSLTDTPAAAATAKRVAGLCRELAVDEYGDKILWQTVAELFELAAGANRNPSPIISHIRTIQGNGEREISLRILGHVLATAHASPEEALSYQLAMIETLVRWYSNREGVQKLVLVPYIESFWRHAIHNCRFAFRAPNLAVAEIESALNAPESERIYALL